MGWLSVLLPKHLITGNPKIVRLIGDEKHLKSNPELFHRRLFLAAGRMAGQCSLSYRSILNSSLSRILVH